MKKTKIKLLVFSIVLLSLFLSYSSALSITFNPPTPANGSTVSSKNVTINATINLDSSPLSSLIFNWNGTNYSLYDDSLVLAYNFDNVSALGENDTVVKDISRYGNNATVIGGPNISWTPNGRYGGAYDFSGFTNYINITNNPANQINFTKSFSFSLWLKLNPVANGLILNIFSVNSNSANKLFDYRLETTAGNYYTSISYFNTTGGNPPQIAGKGSINSTERIWHHFVVTFNNTDQNLSIYTDGGNQLSGIMLNYSMVGVTNNINIGSNRGASGFFNGTLDEVFVYNRTLTPNEVSQLYKISVSKNNGTSYNIISNQTNLSQTLYTSEIIASDKGLQLANSFIRFNIMITAMISNKFSQLLSQVTNTFYGVQAGSGQFLKYGRGIDTNNDGTNDAQSNITWHRKAFLDSKMTIWRQDMTVDGQYSNGSQSNGVNFTGDMTNNTEFMQWAYNNNITVLWIADFMIQSWADNSSGKCTSLRFCPPQNATKYANVVVDFLNRSTNNMQYNNVMVEVWNEPDAGTFWLGGLNTDNQNRFNNYSILYNETYNAIKKAYPNVAIGGVGLTYIVNAPNFTKNFLGNYSNKMDFFSLHQYDYPMGNAMLNQTLTLISYCALYSANCSRIIWSEYNSANIGVLNGTVSGQELNFAQNYITQLTASYAQNLSLIIHHWSESQRYFNNPNSSLYYTGYPYMYSIVSEPQLDNAFYPPYNVTYMFTRQHSPGDTVVNSTSDYNPVKVVASKNGAKHTITIVNTDTDVVNVTINISSDIVPSMINVQTGQIYDTSSGVANIGVVPSYGIVYLSTYNTTTQGGITYYLNSFGEVIFTFTNQLLASQSDACSSMATSITGWLVFIGLLGTVFFLGLVITVVSGFVSLKNGSGISWVTISSGFLTIVSIAVLVIVSLFLIEAFC